MVGEVYQFGIGSLMTLAGMLSINLGLINLFPVPALDGSRLVFLGFEGLRGRPVNPAKEIFCSPGRVYAPHGINGRHHLSGYTQDL